MVGKLGLYGNVICVAPPLVIRPELIDKSVHILERVLFEL
jgi:4-aminobutyrate aminotransferase-like enzyme